ncbi:protein kinase domain-containing protein [Nocardiopsis chromatogenes]|uniref:protein kinase domain-containing protein n=1 Tax=Nocardiopsis chromatogenes TaxID=280239 RepID=UPI000347D4F7|nr:FHA domain-containing serine/threonine-protein kinase [Nocardiopsis chromatogenes]
MTPANPAVTLEAVEGRLDRARWVFEERTTCLLGRADDCDPRLPNDEHHRTVSRHHCLIDISPPHARIRDFGSLNGTYVNGVRIGRRERDQSPEEAAAVAFPEHDLKDGDEIRVGRTVLRVEVSAGREEQAPEPPPAAPGESPVKALRALLDRARGGRADLAAIAGYTVLRELGRGGMGAVYLARHEATGEQVALKVMLPRAAASAQARARFLREAELTGALRHPNVAELRASGFADGLFYFTLEFCAGGGLDGLMASRGGRLPADEATALAVQALRGLEYAHSKGVVHRDLSPSNILLDRPDGGGAPVAKIADFGLAKAFDQAGLSGLTRTGTAAGKPHFMPRQQVVNFKNASPAVDVWAMAACLYAALTGRAPRDFPRGKDPWQLVLQTPAVPVRERAPDVPRALADVVDHGLRERPAIGFATAREMLDALQEATGVPGP